jgi:anti-sigma regulatory factor (Ser/Thr protein kinase)
MGMTDVGKIPLLARLLGREKPGVGTETTAGGDELNELACTFRQTVERLSSLVHELETAHEQALRVEAEKEQFYRDVIRSATHGKLELVKPEELPEPGELVFEGPVLDGKQYGAARNGISEAALATGMDEDRTTDLLLAAGEAITNTMKHATEGRCLVYRRPDAVVVRITDQGTGIGSQQLPAALLMPGYSTKVSLGAGYQMMLKLADRLWLSTGPEGTVVQIEKLVKAPPVEDPLASLFLQR